MKLSNYYNVLKEEQKELDKQYFISKYPLYVDMDGVLTDFDKRFQDFSTLPPKDYENQYGVEKFWDLIDNKTGVKFWVGMDWMPDGKRLWNFVKHLNPTILSAPSRQEQSKIGKHLWIRKHIPGTKTILTYSSNKQNHSGKNRILIDDRKKNIEEWESKGGIGILHTDAFSTIERLKEIGYE